MFRGACQGELERRAIRNPDVVAAGAARAGRREEETQSVSGLDGAALRGRRVHRGVRHRGDGHRCADGAEATAVRQRLP